MTEVVVYYTASPFRFLEGLGKVAEIEKANGRLTPETELNQIAMKLYLIETFTNQLYALEKRKEEGEHK